MSRTTRAAAAVAALAFLVAAGAEVAARILFEQPVPPWVQHPTLGLVRPPSWQATHLDVDGRPFAFRTNALGLRSTSIRSREKPEGTYRIFFAGASTTENTALPEERTFPGRTEALLNERLGGSPRVEVGNAGVSGNVVAHTLAHVGHRLLDLDPDLIVVCDGENDFYTSLRPDWEPSATVTHTTRRVKLKDWLVSASRLLAVLDARVGAGAPKDQREIFKVASAKRRAAPVADPPESLLLRGREAFRATLRKIALLCRDAGVALALMTQPALYKVPQPPEEDQALWMGRLPGTDWNLSTGASRRGVDAMNEVTREVARETGALLIDLAREVPEDLVHLLDDEHLSEKGNARAAEAIVAALLREGRLPRGR